MRAIRFDSTRFRWNLNPRPSKSATTDNPCGRMRAGAERDEASLVAKMFAASDVGMLLLMQRRLESEGFSPRMLLCATFGDAVALERGWISACSNCRMANQPHKLPRAHYVGRRTHFLSACAFCRHSLFRDPVTCEFVVGQLLRASRKHGFVVIAYVLMPDHIHALVEGTRDDSDLLKWLDLFRQLSAYRVKRRSRAVLWQDGVWDYTLRDDDSVAGIASYIVWNPVEAGLVSRPELYPYSGSETSTVSQLAAVPPHKPRVGDF